MNYTYKTQSGFVTIQGTRNAQEARWLGEVQDYLDRKFLTQGDQAAMILFKRVRSIMEL